MSSRQMYRLLISSIDPFVSSGLRPLWNHPAGPKTVFFWCPIMKCGLVLAGLSDLISRPVEKISPYQSTSLAATGFIWSRYCLVIVPKNYALMSVNFIVGCTNGFQLIRFWYARATRSTQ